ncbi:hypothetical protein NPIL_157151 [Nephila pilipes]|uniref:Uncharacterized protein n=1 Tax=Nephila pilipes TaxID=299642 RepID=A0A8X6NQA2_NEPPI|nr:hypothetical protein NPIL_157151 [Nephila pilipes]
MVVICFPRWQHDILTKEIRFTKFLVTLVVPSVSQISGLFLHFSDNFVQSIDGGGELENGNFQFALYGNKSGRS